MTSIATPPIRAPHRTEAGDLTPDHPRRPRSLNRDDVLVVAAAALSSFFLVWLVYQWLTPLPGTVGFAIWWFIGFVVMLWLAVRRLHGRLIAKDRLWTTLITAGAMLVVAPLVLIVGLVLYEGASVLTPQFFTQTAEFCGELNGVNCGGVGHAIIGTLEEVGIAVLIAVPLALLCAIFLHEIGGPLQRPVRLFVDAMSGVPSIVAGLFIYAVWVVGLGRGFSGVGASFALAILMLPTVTRTSVEVLRLVPDGLREGSLALGGSEWRTVWSVVLPTARSGLITAVILGIARSVGETAPLIFTSFGFSAYNFNPLAGPQEALPHYVFEYIRYNPGSAPYEHAWGAAVVLIGLVLGLFTIARVIGARTSVERRQRRAMKQLARIDARDRMREINVTGSRV
jgi:phosphate transport system permease protein